VTEFAFYGENGLFLTLDCVNMAERVYLSKGKK
jgi:hypothetical protein